jgi:chromate transport protein ChrA
MLTTHNIALVGISIVALWFVAILLAAIQQLNKLRSAWINGLDSAMPSNAAIDYLIRNLGLEQYDRLTCVICIIIAMLVWPVSLVFGYPILSTINAHNQNSKSSKNSRSLL